MKIKFENVQDIFDCNNRYIITSKDKERLMLVAERLRINYSIIGYKTEFNVAFKYLKSLKCVHSFDKSSIDNNTLIGYNNSINRSGISIYVEDDEIDTKYVHNKDLIDIHFMFTNKTCSHDKYTNIELI